MLAVFVALEMEERSLLPHVGPLERRSADGFPVAFSRFRNFVVVRTGLGQRAGQAAAALLASRRPEALLSIGFAAGLDPALETGDVFVCREVRLCQEDEDSVLATSGELVAMAQRAGATAGMTVHSGINGTVPVMLTDRDAKLAVREAWDVQTVEMESYWVGRIAETAGIPFLAVRIVLDRLDDDLPQTEGLVTEEGESQPVGALKHLLRHPTQLPGLLTLARASEVAGSSLRRFAGAFIDEWDRCQ
ncbi:MAG TPA: hypothetical protein VFB90_06180 [Dehalococcoidia bacterium]|nr:hypothetical protein [Dehalococcoidia bacterium]